MYGKFDVLHAGHIRLFHFAKSQCDSLIVAVIENIEGLKLRALDLRIKDLSTINLIDKTAVYSNVHDLLRTHKPNVIFKGNEFTRAINEEILEGVYNYCEGARELVRNPIPCSTLGWVVHRNWWRDKSRAHEPRHRVLAQAHCAASQPYAA